MLLTIAILIGLVGVALLFGMFLVSTAKEFPYPDKCWDCNRPQCGNGCFPWEGTNGN